MSEIKIPDLSPKLVALNEIKPYDMNPRKNSDSVKAVRKSFREFGVRAPILVDKDMFIVYGHTRYQAATEEGLSHYPVIVADDLTPEQTRAYRIADNATQDFSQWDSEKLSAELKALATVTFKHLPLTDYGLDEYLPEELKALPPLKDVNFTAKPGAKEIGEGEFQNFDHKCPRCGFHYNEG